MQEEASINRDFFEYYGNIEDYYSHLCPPNESSRMHIVLDLYCKQFPVVDLQTLEHKVYKVDKTDGLCVSAVVHLLVELINEISRFSELNESACQYARKWTHVYRWGSDRHQPEELDGDRLAHFGHSPALF